MSHDRGLPCGTWPSPLSPELCAAGAVSLGFAGSHRGALVWTEGRPAEKGRSALMTWAAAGEPLEILGPNADVRSRVHEYGGTPWCAAGDRLVWSEARDQRLRVRESDGTVRMLTPEGCRYADARALPGPAEGRFIVAVREDHRPVAAGAAREPHNEVVLLDLDAAEDEGRVLWAGSDFVAWPRPSRDGTRLAFVTWNHPSMPWDETQLVVGRLEAGALVAARVVAGGPAESVLEPQWDEDGTLFCLSDRTGWWNLYRCAGLEGPSRVLEPVTRLEAEIGAPLWQLGSQSYVLLSQGHGQRRALVRMSRDARDTLALLDLGSGVLTPLELPFVAFGSLGQLDAHTAFAIAAGTRALPALVTVDLREGAPAPGYAVMRSAGHAPIAREAISVAQAVTFPTAPGPLGEARSAHAWFYPPHLPGCRPRPGERPPLVVLLHGGPTSVAAGAFKVNVQFWTTRGFAVVDVNYGGSTSFGRPYRERLRGQWGVVDLQDAVAAVDHLVASGLVDGERVAIRGGSAGGFTVLSALAFTRRFAAGINYYGVADLETLATDTHKFEARYLDSLVAPLPEGRDIYRARSPVHHMGRCHGALLTLQGTEDRAVPPQQSRDVVAAARAAGCRVEYLEFEGEGHGFRQQANIVRGMEAELAFLGEVFGF
jgi:dipeptidyl aminopeptidase/acylaminoacyl peptidase